MKLYSENGLLYFGDKQMYLDETNVQWDSSIESERTKFKLITPSVTYWVNYWIFINKLQNKVGASYTDYDSIKSVFTINNNDSGMCIATHTLAANSDTIIAGGLFTPPITIEPIAIIVFLSGVQQNVGSVSYALNGGVYDITINTTEAIVNAKINVLI